MLKFMRNKLISVFSREQGKIAVHGLLSDDVYELELQVELQVPELKILSIEGKWNRYTTPECPRAIPLLQEAVGLTMGEGFSERVKKIIGTKACRHYANLLLECCYSAKETVLHVMGERANHQIITMENPKIDHKTDPTAASHPKQASGSAKLEQSDTGCIIDLHVHSSPASPCSSAPVDELVSEARRIGLYAFCLTDHNYTWSKADVDKLMEKHEYLILRGNEITTDQGHMLVFGLEKEINGIIKLEELSQEVRRAKGYMIVAHPFRGFLAFGVGQLGLTPQQAMRRPLFKYVNAIEVLNGKTTKDENAFALEVAQGLGMPTTGGSDAHEVNELGLYATKFDEKIGNEKDFIEALQDKAFRPLAYRKERGIK